MTTAEREQAEFDATTIAHLRAERDDYRRMMMAAINALYKLGHDGTHVDCEACRAANPTA